MNASLPAARDRFFQLFLITFALFLYALVVNAWVVDDAYITFRTIDNFTHGYGLTWNVSERVQAYTHPLWMMVMTVAYLITSEFFYTTIVVCLILTLAGVVISASAFTDGFKTNHWKLPLLVLGLLSSKAFVDFASSGLENALSYFIAAMFFARFLTEDQKHSLPENQLRHALLWASLAFVNRPDSVLLFVPPLLYLLYSARSRPLAPLLGYILTATIPATAWILFSLIYYGFPFPNTAYAKSICTGFPFSWKLHRGIEYLTNSMRWDTASHLLLLLGALLLLKKRSHRAWISLCGVLLYIGAIVISFASATHMSGRFLSLPFFVGILIFVFVLDQRRAAVAITAILAAYILIHPLSALRFGTSFYAPGAQPPSSIDTKWFASREGAALIDWRPGRKLPDHSWYHYGERLRKSNIRVHIGGAFGWEPIGYTGFTAGPHIFIIDTVALSDPLLARMPAIKPATYQQWKSGHFFRQIPEGYVESVATGRNVISDPNIHRYYEVIRNITRGTLFRMDRFRDIWTMNFGRNPGPS